MYLFGGFLTDRNSNQLYRLDLTTLTWELVDAQGDLPIPCDKMAGWTYRDCFYVFGGFGISPRAGVQRPSDFAFLHDMQAPWRGWTNQLVVFNTQTNSWSWPMYKGTAPVARAAHAAARINDQVFVFGGRHQQSRLNDIHRLDLGTMHWTGALRTIGEKPRGRSWHSFTALPPVSHCPLRRVQPDGRTTVVTASKRICLERALRLRHVLQSQWPMLPPSVRDTLYLMHGNTQGSRLDGS
ncbi:hypothetical protein MTO96_037721 [Rhipicephalus appendiculatus]